ncbi:DUF2339 domain-containing protein [Vibrio sp. MarTm2]|uniref:DUF2339 domain-containing protein n=1 Tax=Vibrio sp. MarTm2 TaxID=2998831 RepID=UPI0022CD60CE|nr:DUF2339 domain-containing protein [Vibrio sp. MarTm2]MDA0130547.1 DUF2339 domain-containing protein [Vibrio sp. MarTm2]
MELVGLLLGLLLIIVILVSPLMSLWACRKIIKLESRVHDLEQLASARQPQKQEQSTQQDTPSYQSPKVPLPRAKVEPAIRAVKPVAKVDATTTEWFDNTLSHIKKNWLIWIGGIAMVIGAGYLVQAIGSNFTLTPFARTALAITISLIFFAAAEWLHHKIGSTERHLFHAKVDAYIPAVLYATGMSGLYATICFSAIVYQLISPPIALTAIGILAVAAIAFSLRMGPLMIALGLFGGYSAPLWIGGEDPSYLLLSAYITTITAAGLMIRRFIRPHWLICSVTTGQALWLLLICINITQEQALIWFVLFIPVSVYLLTFIPHLGWRLEKPIRVKEVYNHPLIAATLLALVTSITLARIDINQPQAVLLFLFPVALLIFPMMKSRAAPRVLSLVTLVAMAITEHISVTLTNQIDESGGRLVWIATGGVIVLVGARTIGQYFLGDRKPMSYCLALLSLPCMLIGSQLYINLHYSNLLGTWSSFSLILGLGFVASSHNFKQLQQESSTVLHLIIASTCYCLLPADWFMLAVSIQVLLASSQYRFELLKPNLWLIKGLVGLITIRLTLLPFVPAWQATSIPESITLITSFLPALILLQWSGRILEPLVPNLKQWLEVTCLNLGALLIFSQSNFLLLGSYNFIADFDFRSVSLFTLQSLAMFAIYSLKARSARFTANLYLYASYIMLAIAITLSVALNTVYQPLLGLNISGEATPIVNWLSVGWLLPGLLSIAIGKRLRTPLKSAYFYWVSSIQIGLWAIYSIRQFWQEGSMSINAPTSMAELFSYTALFIFVGATATYNGAQRSDTRLQKVGLIVLGVAVCKVFLIDTSNLEGLWRAVSMLGLGASLVGLGWLFQRLRSKNIVL